MKKEQLKPVKLKASEEKKQKKGIVSMSRGYCRHYHKAGGC